MVDKKGETARSHIPVDGGKLRNAIISIGMTNRAFSELITGKKYKLNDYIYKDNAMPQNLFFQIIEALEVNPEDIAAEDHKLYGRSWNAKREMAESLERLRIRAQRDPSLEKEYTDAFAKFAPYLIPKVAQEETHFTPAEWSQNFSKTLIAVKNEEEVEGLSDVDRQVYKNFIGDADAEI